MSDAKPESLQEFLAGLPSRTFQRGALTIIVSLIVGGAAVVFAQVKATEAVRVVVDGGVGPLRRDFDVHVLESQEAHRRQDTRQEATDAKIEAVLRMLISTEERNARRFDALQLTILERKAPPESAELAKPVTDGGR